jgi:microcystin-dependent protein
MATESFTSGLTLTIPTKGTRNWAETLRTFVAAISGHDHTGSGKGKQLTADAFADDTLTDVKYYIRNNNWLRARNAAATAFLNLLKADTGNDTILNSPALLKLAIAEAVKLTLSGTEITPGAALDLGTSGNKFKDLYLSGNIAVGGTVDGVDIAGRDADLTAVEDLADQNAADIASLSGASGLVPSGTIVMTGRASAPTGYLLCNGAAVSRSTYAELFSAISTAYGAGDGATTFNVPDMRGRFPLGKAASGTGSTLGEADGSLDHTHTGPSHRHNIGHTHTIPNHQHTVRKHYHAMGTGADLNITSSGSHTHTGVTDSALSGYDGTIRVQASDRAGGNANSYAPSAGKTAIITITNAFDPAHQHVIDAYAAAHTHAAGNFSGRIGIVTGGIDGNSDQLTTSSGTCTTSTISATVSGYEGDGATGGNNPAYCVVNYMIKT